MTIDEFLAPMSEQEKNEWWAEHDLDTYTHNLYMAEYSRQHECCPKCGASTCSTTLVGFIMDLDNPDDYVDKNGCICTECGDSHIRHDRVPVNTDEEYEEI